MPTNPIVEKKAVRIWGGFTHNQRRDFKLHTHYTQVQFVRTCSHIEDVEILSDSIAVTLANWSKALRDGTKH
jgi:hypothetical protein